MALGTAFGDSTECLNPTSFAQTAVILPTSQPANGSDGLRGDVAAVPGTAFNAIGTRQRQRLARLSAAPECL